MSTTSVSPGQQAHIGADIEGQIGPAELGDCNSGGRSNRVGLGEVEPDRRSDSAVRRFFGMPSSPHRPRYHRLRPNSSRLQGIWHGSADAGWACSNNSDFVFKPKRPLLNHPFSGSGVPELTTELDSRWKGMTTTLTRTGMLRRCCELPANGSPRFRYRA